MAWTLTIGDKNLSSWSMRPWLALKKAGAPFEERMIRLNQEDTPRLIDEVSPSGRVPALDAGGVTIWDSLAISEFVAERFPQANLWPDDAERRAVARSAAAEMHSGFPSLRGECPMNIVLRETRDLTPITGEDIRRVVKMFDMLRGRYADGGDFLVGPWSIADAFFTPVATRFRSYGVKLSDYGDTGAAGAYCDQLLNTPEFLEWERDATAETQAD